jgi:hypothetical protein
VSHGTLNLGPAERGLSRRAAKCLWLARSPMVVSVWFFLILSTASGQEVPTHPWPIKILHRLLVPLRASPFSQSSVRPCRLGLATCFSSASSMPTRRSQPRLANSSGPLMIELRTDHSGPLAHHWLQLEGPEVRMTIGFGPATLPFIDSGQVSLQDSYGNIERISGMHPLPWLALPPVNYHYAPSPGEGHMAGEPIPLTMAQSDALIGKLHRMKFVGPYIPIFHDCRTFTCALVASAQGHSTLPCYLLFKGYW